MTALTELTAVEVDMVSGGASAAAATGTILAAAVAVDFLGPGAVIIVPGGVVIGPAYGVVIAGARDGRDPRFPVNM